MTTMNALTRLVEVLLFAGLLAIGYLSTPSTGLSEVTCSVPGTTQCTEWPSLTCEVNDCPNPPYVWNCGCGAYGPSCVCGGAP